MAGVAAGRSVLARFMVGAVVQVEVAKESSPAFVAVALVGLGT